MKVFLTGATGFIGSRIVRELKQAGHAVLGMARNDAGEAKLKGAGVEALRGDVTDVASLRAGVEAADAVIHTAFIHDFTKFKQNCEIDRRAIEAMSEAMLGTEKLMIVTSGTAITRPTPETPSMEDGTPITANDFPRAATEEAVRAAEARGARAVVVRLPQVHDTKKQGLVTPTIQIAREKGVAAYVGEGLNRWPAAHVDDVARLYRLALDKNEAGARYNAVAEEGVRAKDIAEAVGRGLRVPVVSIAPEQTMAHFGPFGFFMQWDLPASSVMTRAKLGWEPAGPDLITDLNNMDYSAA